MAPLFSSCFERVSGKRSDFDRFGRLAAFTGARVGLAARRRGDAMSRTFTPVESSNRPPHDCGKNPVCVICPETGRRSRPRRRGRRMRRLCALALAAAATGLPVPAARSRPGATLAVLSALAAIGGLAEAKLDEDYVLFSESSQLGSVGRGLAQKRRDALRTELAQARK